MGFTYYFLGLWFGIAIASDECKKGKQSMLLLLMQMQKFN